MKQTLQLKLTQHLTLTPQLQQSIRLLQLSTMELNQELERFLAENPLLERDEGEEDGAPAGRLNGTATVSTVSADTASPDAAPSPADDLRPAADDWYLEAGGSSAARDDSDEAEYPQQLAAESPSLRDHLL
ncbi:MAG: RNA polymerase factor sigma-54, partial [Burkholderiales bacterium]